MAHWIYECGCIEKGGSVPRLVYFCVLHEKGYLSKGFKKLTKKRLLTKRGNGKA